MDGILDRLAHAALLSFSMAWHVLWSLILGFVLSGLVQSLVSQNRMQAVLGDASPRSLTLAAGLGAASSSCSYASAAISRALFAGGASFATSMAFLIASTNLVIELGLVLWLLMGWQFTLAEWLGGCVMIAVLAGLLRIAQPTRLVENARQHAQHAAGHTHEAAPVAGNTLLEKLRNPDLPVRVAQSFAADLRMLWKDIVLGFVIAGGLAAFVPASWWAALFLHSAPTALRIPADALLAPLVAVISFVCSIGNVPMAAILWQSGVGFGGVLAFLYADLIVLPLFDVYRRAYGLRAALFITGLLYATMVIAGLTMHLLFVALHLVPPRHAVSMLEMTPALDATSLANVLSIVATAGLFAAARRRPALQKHCCGQHG